MLLNIYRMTSHAEFEYDTYDSCVVVAASEEDAKKIHPRAEGQCLAKEIHDGDTWGRFNVNGVWCPQDIHETWPNDLSKIEVERVGTTGKFEAGTVICASFNAG